MIDNIIWNEFALNNDDLAKIAAEGLAPGEVSYAVRDHRLVLAIRHDNGTAISLLACAVVGSGSCTVTSK